MARASLRYIYNMTETVIISIMAVGAQTRWALLHSVCDMITPLIDVQRSLIQELLLMSLNRAITPRIQPETVVLWKVKAQSNIVEN